MKRPGVSLRKIARAGNVKSTAPNGLSFDPPVPRISAAAPSRLAENTSKNAVDLLILGKSRSPKTGLENNKTSSVNTRIPIVNRAKPNTG